MSCRRALSGLYLCLFAVPVAAGTSGPLTVGNATYTNSTTSETTITVLPPTTVQVNDFLTRIIASENGGPNIFDQSFNVAFSDPTVQAAVTAAQAALTGAGAKSIVGPTLISNNTSLQSSVTALVNTTIGTNVTVNTITTFGPATVMYGPNQSLTFIVGVGDTEYNTNTDSHTFIDQQSVTTNTFLTSQTYELFGNSVPPSPAPATWLLALGGLGVLAGRQRRRRHA